MGKTKKVNTNRNKMNPTGLLDTDDGSVDLNEEPNSHAASILSQINNSTDDDNKICALEDVSNWKWKIQDIADNDLVRSIAPLLIDPNLSVCQAAAGALRNLSSISVEICEVLVSQDLLTSICFLLNQYVNDWLPKIDKKSSSLDIKSDIYLQAVHICTNLCESTSVAVDFFNQSQLIHSFTRCMIAPETFGIELAVSTAQCLLVVSEENKEAWKILSNFNNQFQNVLRILDEDFQSVLLRTIVAGIMSNVPSLLLHNLQSIIDVLSRTLNFNHRSVLNEITSELPLHETTNLQIEVVDEQNTLDSVEMPHQESQPELEQKIKLVGFLLSAQRMAAEILSNICSPEDNETDEFEDFNASDDDMNSEEKLQAMDRLPIEISEAIIRHKIVEKLWLRAQILPQNVLDLLNEFEKTLYERASSLRVSCLMSLQNLCNCMDADALGGKDTLYQVWLVIGQQIFQNKQDSSLVEASTSLMRATLEHLKNYKYLFQQITDSDLQLILNGIQECEKSETRANLLRMLGTLGCLVEETLAKKILEFMLITAMNETDVWALSETADSFMDMFADNDWNQLVIDCNIIPKSKEIEKILKTKMRQQKKDLGTRYPAVLTVKSNLGRFCKYLEQTAFSTNS